MNRENVRIYDYFYGAGKLYMAIYLDDEIKSNKIDEIFNTLPFEEQNVIRTCVHHSRIGNKSIWNSLNERRKLMKKFETASRHMYYPSNIEIAIPGFYKCTGKRLTKITEVDFGKKYIVTALNRSGIYYKEQLKIHLDNGWRFLWTIPGIGDGARISIITAIDNGYFKKKRRK